MTLGCWILCELQDAGIDTSKYTPYTTRHASASAAMARGMPIDDILALGGGVEHTVFFHCALQFTYSTDWGGTHPTDNLLSLCTTIYL